MTQNRIYKPELPPTLTEAYTTNARKLFPPFRVFYCNPKREKIGEEIIRAVKIMGLDNIWFYGEHGTWFDGRALMITSFESLSPAVVEMMDQKLENENKPGLPAGL